MNKTKLIDRLYYIIGFIWLTFMLMFPSDFQEIKYPALIILLIICIFDLLSRNKPISKNLVFGMLIWLTYFSFSLLIGVFKGFSIDFSLISIYFITPIVAVLLSNIINNEKRFVTLNKMLILITFMIVVLDIVYILNRMSVISMPFNFNSPIFGSVYVENQKIEFRITNQSSLIFLLPYILVLHFSYGHNSIKGKYLIFVTMFLGIIVALLSGRRAFQAVVLISLILIIILLKFKKERFKSIRRSNLIKWFGQVLIILAVILSSYNWLSEVLGLDNLINSAYKTFLSAFDLSSRSGSIRAMQVSMFTEEWGNSPLVGNGLNSYLANYTASTTTPWSYEMVYFALLYQTGIIGITIFFGTVYLITSKIYKRISLETSHTRSYFMGILVGFVCFIIAGGSNPMVYYVWAWSFAMIDYQKNNNEISLLKSYSYEVKV